MFIAVVTAMGGGGGEGRGEGGGCEGKQWICIDGRNLLYYFQSPTLLLLLVLLY